MSSSGDWFPQVINRPMDGLIGCECTLSSFVHTVILYILCTLLWLRILHHWLIVSLSIIAPSLSGHSIQSTAWLSISCTLKCKHQSRKMIICGTTTCCWNFVYVQNCWNGGTFASIYRKQLLTLNGLFWADFIPVNSIFFALPSQYAGGFPQLYCN